MADIFQQFPIKAPAEAVFQAISTPAGLDTWWTKRSSGQPVEGATYELGFGPGYDWRAVVSRCAPKSVFEVEMTSAVDEWRGTRVGLLLDAGPGVSCLRCLWRWTAKCWNSTGHGDLV